MARKRTDPVGLRLRFSEVLRRRIERAAKEHHPPHSMNAEIIERLEQSFRREDLTVERQAVAVAASILENPAVKNFLAKISPEDLADAQRAMGLPVPNFPPPEEVAPPGVDELPNPKKATKS